MVISKIFSVCYINKNSFKLQTDRQTDRRCLISHKISLILQVFLHQLHTGSELREAFIWGGRIGNSLVICKTGGMRIPHNRTGEGVKGVVQTEIERNICK